MEQYHGMTAEMYRAVTALVDDRMKQVLVTRQDYDRLAEAQARTEERLSRVEAALEHLAEAQTRTEERLNRLEVTVQKLAQAQAHTEKRLKELAQAQARTEKRLEELAQAQAHTEKRLEELAQAQAHTERRLQELIGVVAGVQNTLAAVKGRQLEITYRERAGAYFGPLLRRPRVLSPIELEEDLEAHLSDEEFKDLLHLDLLVSGQPRHRPEAPPVWLAVEVSAVVDSHDVERAQRRAAALRQAGYRAVPAVAGEQATEEAEQKARVHKVVLLRDGWASFWEEALNEAL